MYSQEARRFVGGVTGAERSRFSLTTLLLAASDVHERGTYQDRRWATALFESVRTEDRRRAWDYRIPPAVDDYTVWKGTP